MLKLTAVTALAGSAVVSARSVGPAPSQAAISSSGTPVWLSIALAILTLAGVLASAFFLRKTGREARTSAEELDRRGKREETMRTLRWAAERAVCANDGESRLGIAVLDSLGGSRWLEREDQDLIDAVIGSVTASATDAYHELGSPAVYEILPAEDVATGEPRPTAGDEEALPDE